MSCADFECILLIEIQNQQMTAILQELEIVTNC